MLQKFKFKCSLIFPVVLISLISISCGVNTTTKTSNPVLNVQKEKAAIVESKTFQEGEPIPFGAIEKVPIYPGCESKKTTLKQKNCLAEKVQIYVNRNFNTSLGKKYEIKGIVKVFVSFEINKEGDVTNIIAEGPHPKIEEEAVRVISSLPHMIPGEYEGEKVSVSYTLPIMFWEG
ncbi:TonB-like protein [Gillisia mitskevichiae]|uniref:TonB-like protein n=1 Tax=Gillisia mitskevichiae TaxID=270921 RepID=A0A495PZE3_9FLAO|nr:energy transducer TonB [Gillisia mitskevichiae]RKS55896.1 TonB-like protein [Gillisia mitskevichiae]